MEESILLRASSAGTCFLGATLTTYLRHGPVSSASWACAGPRGNCLVLSETPGQPRDACALQKNEIFILTSLLLTAVVWKGVFPSVPARAGLHCSLMQSDADHHGHSP